MRHILKIFKKKNKGSQEPTQRLKEIIGVSGARYNPDYYKIIKLGCIADKETNKIVDILREAK